MASAQMGIVSPGFQGRRRSADRTLPPGQYLTEDFPVLSAGPTPRIPLEQWEFVVTAYALARIGAVLGQRAQILRLGRDAGEGGEFGVLAGHPRHVGGHRRGGVDPGVGERHARAAGDDQARSCERG